MTSVLVATTQIKGCQNIRSLYCLFDGVLENAKVSWTDLFYFGSVKFYEQSLWSKFENLRILLWVSRFRCCFVSHKCPRWGFEEH